jgi:hypothetical protein
MVIRFVAMRNEHAVEWVGKDNGNTWEIKYGRAMPDV